MTEHPLEAIARFVPMFDSLATVAAAQGPDVSPELCRMASAAMREAAEALDAYAALSEGRVSE